MVRNVYFQPNETVECLLYPLEQLLKKRVEIQICFTGVQKILL